MLLVSYDISDDRLRTKFSKFLEKYGYRIQYSVFQIKNSQRVMNNICIDIENRFLKRFSENDSVYIFCLSAHCEIKRYGYARNEEKELIIV
jgi:CRISPR-associated protein Cas2